MSSTGDRIRPDDENPRYWQFDGEPVLLLGGTNTDNLFQWTGSQLTDHLDLLVDHGGNYVRNTMSDRGSNDVHPFCEIREGVYDLDRWNEAYWNRLETFLEETATRDVVVQLTLWDQHDFGNWESNPWNPYNNVNYGRYESGLSGAKVFFTAVDRNATVYEYQERFVDRILETSLSHDHVLYNINNESWAGGRWERHWGEHVHTRAAEAGTHVEVTSMDMWPGQSIATVLRNPELFSYVDFSQANQTSKGWDGQAHWEAVRAAREEIAENHGPLPVNNVKIYGGEAGADNYGDAAQAVERYWRNVIGGCASARFHRPIGSHAGIGLNERARQTIESVRAVADAVDIFSMTPRNDLLHDRTPNEAYCAANPGREYLVYFPDGGSIGLDLELADAASLRLEWLDADRGEWTGETTLSDVTRCTLSPSRDGNWVAVLRVR